MATSDASHESCLSKENKDKSMDKSKQVPFVLFFSSPMKNALCCPHGSGSHEFTSTTASNSLDLASPVGVSW